jgi:hypothetical protein
LNQKGLLRAMGRVAGPLFALFETGLGSGIVT